MADTTQGHLLFIIILDQPEMLDDLLTGFLDVGVRGATVLECRGMGSIVSQDMPFFSGLASLFPESTGSKMIMSVIPRTQKDQVYQLVEEVVGALEQPNSAICFTLPVEDFQGIRLD